MDTTSMATQPATTIIAEKVPASVMMFKAPSVAAAKQAAEPETLSD